MTLNGLWHEMWLQLLHPSSQITLVSWAKQRRKKFADSKPTMHTLTVIVTAEF